MRIHWPREHFVQGANDQGRAPANLDSNLYRHRSFRDALGDLGNWLRSDSPIAHFVAPRGVGTSTWMRFAASLRGVDDLAVGFVMGGSAPDARIWESKTESSILVWMLDRDEQVPGDDEVPGDAVQRWLMQSPQHRILKHHLPLEIHDHPRPAGTFELSLEPLCDDESFACLDHFAALWDLPLQNIPRRAIVDRCAGRLSRLSLTLRRYATRRHGRTGRQGAWDRRSSGSRAA
ncbi:MAG: hypothetical protein AAF958_00170 [Planctomycetota bacterium]